MHNGDWNYGMGNGNWVPMMIMMDPPKFVAR